MHTNGSGCTQGVNNVGALLDGSKDTILNPSDKKVLHLLRKGGAYTGKEITEVLNIAHPQAHIRNLRNAGYTVSDYRISTGFSRRKKYFLKEV